MYLGQNESEDKREDVWTYDAVHVEVKVIELDAIWVWSGNVKGELYEFAKGIRDLDFVLFAHRGYWMKEI